MTTQKGTFQYVAPELWSGDGEYDYRVDVYSMGAIMFEMLVGKNPVDAGCYKVANGMIEVADIKEKRE